MEESISVAVRWRPFVQISGEKMDLQKIHDTVSKFVTFWKSFHSLRKICPFSWSYTHEFEDFSLLLPYSICVFLLVFNGFYCFFKNGF